VAQASKSGSEPLEVQLDHFAEPLRGRKRPSRAPAEPEALRGVGNIYADESLFRAGIRPPAATINVAKTCDALSRGPGSVGEAIALGGSSVSDYVDADGEEGFFQLQHRVYGRAGEPCLVCKT
jgi:formamidopyrimidine-DNA glycosylase